MGMNVAVDTVRDRFELLRSHSPAELVASVRQRVHYDNDAYGLRRDLTVPLTPPEPRIPLRVRPLEDRDTTLLDDSLPGLAEDERAERRMRCRMLDAGLRTPYVAVTEQDEPAYIQWLIGPEQNDLVRLFFRGIFPRLAEDEVLLEGAFTPASHRGKRVMPHAMAVIAGLGAERGARAAYTFVSQDNGASLAGCERSGFFPVMTRRESWHGFRHTIEFGALPGETPRRAAGVVQ